MKTTKESTGSLGWVGIKDDEQVRNLRQYLSANTGIRGLEILQPNEISRAVELFYRDGFVVIEQALQADQVAFLKAGCDREIRNIISRDANRVGNRGSHRYSFGGASLTGHLMHHPEWAMLVDLPTVSPVLSAIFGSDDYICRGGGGDFCLPGAVKYQPLHSDMNDRVSYTDDAGQQRSFGSFHDPRGKLNYRDLPCPYVCCNYLTTDFTALNGPTRQIPGTQHSQAPMPRLRDEPEWMKLSTVCPAPAGAVMIRDVRAWHGGTPNLTGEARAIPNAEYFAPWFREPLSKSMPREVFDKLSGFGKKLSRFIVADPGADLITGYREDIGSTKLQGKTV